MTDNSSKYQPGEEDFRLAALLDAGTGIADKADSTDDPLLPLLQQYKSSASLKYGAFAGEKSWRLLEKELDRRARKAVVYNIRPVYLKAAAVVLAALLLTLSYLILRTEEPLLLAESGSVITAVELADRSYVTLRPNSRLFQVDISSEQHLYKIEGEGYFDVASGPERSFTVLAGDTRVDVTGTRFTLSDWGNRVRLFLESGSVRFSSSDRTSSADLLPGQFSEFREGAVSEPVLSDGKEYTAWLANELVLESRTFASVADEVEFHFGIRLIIPDNLLDEELSGTLPLAVLQDLLGDLALTMDGEFVEVEEGVYRFVPNS
jgi:ferric-dicitrate binding protein FerR (iron transport regulator)